ncbi:MAG TPA: hypothetical protein P5514_11770 [Bacteroidales bacterium]|nr:hypothetical protein [Bacteroidales bacterium]HPE54976.1 hypothetical protein [Bacteroidales bacterium]HRX97617.1 hypothetical protein [Bacteroidales bacterium]
MRKFTLLLAMCFAAFLSFSQTTLTTAVDFTATNTEGEEFNLFEILDGGQYVAIDFFFTT